MKETLESILNQNQVLSEVVKTVDSSCPDPFTEPEKFSVFFAQKTISSRSYSDDLFEEAGGPEVSHVKDNDNKDSANPAISSVPPVSAALSLKSVEIENALVKLQNLRMEEQKRFQYERENYETRLGQLSLLQQEIEILRKQNSEHEIQLEFWKCKNSLNGPIDEELKILKMENETFKRKNEELSDQNKKIAELESEFSASVKRIGELENEVSASENKINELQGQLNSKADDSTKQENEQLKNQLEETLLLIKSQQESSENQEEKDRKFRELSEENVRLKIEFNELEKELTATRIQLNDFEKETICVHDDNHNNNNNECDSSLNSPSSVINEDESAFKYIYLSNLVLKFMQFPEKRTDLSNIILTTLQTDQEYFQRVMRK